MQMRYTPRFGLHHHAAFRSIRSRSPLPMLLGQACGASHLSASASNDGIASHSLEEIAILCSVLRAPFTTLSCLLRCCPCPNARMPHRRSGRE
ncbi:hypothetical protein N431DRAFT_431221 [Stipitochalara longipes BDJ]|nr:hypothetical protein N431DRAFT_431221 [Stipitochalara longipes BDJ]